jgi:uncharacterized protein
MLTKEQILECIEKNRIQIKSYGVKNLFLFGSFAKETATNNSDIDFIVEFEKYRGTYKDYMSLLIFLQDILKKDEIDLIKKNSIRKEFRDEILNGVKYAAKL